VPFRRSGYVVPGIQGFLAAAKVRASSQPMPWRAAVARQERMAQKVSAPVHDQQPDRERT
jgi:hypothetical protein